jgi:hypothetical protein
VLTKDRIDALFTLRAAAKMAEREVDTEFMSRWGFDPFDREAGAIVGRQWVVDRWSELYEVKPAVIEYEAANRTLSTDERKVLAVMADCEEFEAPRLDLLLDCLEARWRARTH